VCVVVDNDGGGIFSFLPQARALDADRFETLFGTPHGLDLVAVAASLGVTARRLDPREEVTGAVAEAAAEGGLQVLVVPTDRAANVEAHRRIDDAVAAAVEAALTA
jgi:2-succinyl-5-enolpyruvyl-6-hydroxy-3-cyclohexene-1-carboxylate synthase